MTIVLDGSLGITSPAESVSGNLTFTGTGNRITGDFSNATIANRVAFQTSTANSASRLLSIPNGTGDSSAFAALNSSDANNASWTQISTNAANSLIQATISGTGTYLPMVFQTGGSERVRIDTSGNVGIGTSSPTAKLDVAGGIKLSGQLMAGTSGSVFSPLVSAGYISGTSNIYIRNVSGTNRIDSYNDPITATIPFQINASQQAFYIADAEKMRIDTSGNLLVGTTTNLTSVAKLSVYNTGGGSGGAAIGYGSAAGQFRVMYLLSGNGVFYFDNGTNAASLNAAGAWTNASDARLKNSITDIKYGLSAVLSTQPRSYKMNDLEGDYFGFIAQELQTVLPEVVSGDPEKQLGVDYGSLVAVAFKAIQEQQTLITALTARITALEQA